MSLDEDIHSIFDGRMKLLQKIFRPTITVEDLLTMQSGVDFNEMGAVSGNDWVGGFLEAPVRGTPGTEFEYNSMNSYMLSANRDRTDGNVHDGISEIPSLGASEHQAQFFGKPVLRELPKAAGVCFSARRMRRSWDNCICRTESGRGSGFSRKAGWSAPQQSIPILRSEWADMDTAIRSGWMSGREVTRLTGCWDRMCWCSPTLKWFL